MAIIKSHQVSKTKSGIFVRRDTSIGLLAHSPFTGLTYAVHPSDEERVLKWLKGSGVESPSDSYKYSLGVGWAISKEEARHIGPHLLPTPSSFDILQAPDSPILINWFLTGRCPLACTYCYAEDLMRNEELEPNSSTIEKSAESILRLNPLVVVLTGGDPLFSPYLAQAIKLLYGKVGIVIDTSAYTFTHKHLELFKKYDITVRISFDSERPKVNQAQRPLYSGYPQLLKKGRPTAEVAINALCQCLDEGISVTVQTVATKKTANDLVALGDKLYRLGVRSWRIFKVAPSNARYENYKKLVGSYTDSGKKITGKQAYGPYSFAFSSVRTAAETNWEQKMAVQIAGSEAANAVILVGPDGKFYTESNVTETNMLRGKILLDDNNPKSPSLSAVKSKVDMQGHIERYLNLTR
jgi:MoaA/NifB/PqqE/SkfB family radical SAM enzyme